MQDLSISNKKPQPDSPRLNVNQTPTKSKAKKKKEVADSWEDELSSGSETEREEAATTSAAVTPSTTNTSEGPLAPPPTPISPQEDVQKSQPWLANVHPSSSYGYSSNPSATSSSRRPSELQRRPEKQTAVASRMITGALGIRAPKRTEEQRAYDRAMKENEIKRRNHAREEEARAREEEERAKAAIWND